MSRLRQHALRIHRDAGGTEDAGAGVTIPQWNKGPPDSILCSPGHRVICIIGVAVLDELLLVNPLAQMGDRRREGDDEGTSETREQHACSRYRDQVN